jgi:hypothetical protein
MPYFVKRGEERYGPYSLTDLQQYVESGNVLLTDMAQSEGMVDWVPVSQVLGDIPAPTQQPPMASAVEPELVPLPPNWHWSIVLILGIVTRELFNLAWALVQGNWARKLTNNNKPLVLIAMYPAAIVAGIFTVAVSNAAPLGSLFILSGVIFYLFGIFSIKHAMEEYYNSIENIGLTLSGAMTFFFSTVYIQYHINRLHRWKKTGTLT